MEKPTIKAKKRLLLFLFCSMCGYLLLTGRLVFIELFRAEELQELAYEQQTRDRLITPKRGAILDRNGEGIALTETVNAVSVIPVQVKEKEKTAQFLAEMLDLEYDEVLEKIKQRVALVRIKTKVDTETAAAIRRANYAGVEVDEDVRRIYPYTSMAAQVIGFVGKDNQGIIGLEAKYDRLLEGERGKILTLTDSRGNEVDSEQERIPPVDGKNLVTTMDVVMQQYAEQTIAKAVETKGAKRGVLIILNPQNGEIMAMVNVPEFHLNDPFTLTEAYAAEGENRQELLNRMWRNPAINDTYEPGSTFKIITAAAGLEAGAVGLEDHFSCPGFRIVEDRKIRCHKTGGHGGETFLQGVMNSCNPVFIDVGQRLGVDRYYHYFEQFGLKEKTGIDLPGEAGTIMHKKENMGLVELATVSFGQSFQITPIQLITTAASIINGGNRVTPHFAVRAVSSDRTSVHRFSWPVKEHIVSEETSASMRYILEQVVAEGSGKKAAVEGFRIGGKTATSEKLPRSLKKYISSFIGFAPADNPRVIALITIDEPQGVYYGGTIAAPVIADIFKNILPYLGIPEAVEETAGSMGISS